MRARLAPAHAGDHRLPSAAGLIIARTEGKTVEAVVVERFQMLIALVAM